jgi:hypothetical protein
MLDIAALAKVAVDQFPYQIGAFYGASAGLALGVGLVVDGVTFPLFDEAEGLFDTARGLVYVLTHECDLDNERAFNDYVLVCPIIGFDVFAEGYAEKLSEGALAGLIPDLAGDRIYRALYVPPISNEVLPFGGIIYFNQICSTHVSSFKVDGAKNVCALSSYAQQIIDMKLTNHLLRPKAEPLPRLH